MTLLVHYFSTVSSQKRDESRWNHVCKCDPPGGYRRGPTADPPRGYRRGPREMEEWELAEVTKRVAGLGINVEGR